MDNDPVAHGLLARWGTRHDNGRVNELTEPQVWVLIGLFASVMFAMMGVVAASFTRVLRAEIGGLRAEMNARFERVDVQFQRVDDRFEHLDRDIQAITRRVFPDRD